MFMKSCRSLAGKRYQMRVAWAMGFYAVALVSCSWLVKNVQLGEVLLGIVAVLPALPVLAVLIALGRYLQEESDEYMRMLSTRSLLVGAGALLSTVVVSDFLRALADGPALPPFVGFMVFFVAFGIAQGVQQLRSRADSDG